MEPLLNEEIVKDDCKCCLKTIDSLSFEQIIVTLQLKEVFQELLSDELEDGFICNSCNENIKNFHRFKSEIILSRQRFQEISQHETEHETEWTEWVKEEREVYCSEDLLSPIDQEELEVDAETFVEDSSQKQEQKHENLRRVLQSKFVQKLSSIKLEQKEILHEFKPPLVMNETRQFSTKSPKVECPLCRKSITSRALQTHLKTHDSNRERSFMCEICSKTYLNKHEMVVHRRNHLNIRPFKCDFDDKTFTSKNNLSKHIHNQHLNLKRTVDFKILCPVCKKLFPFQSKMIEHFKKAHPGGRDDGVKVNPATNHFHCDKCGYEFLTKYRIDNHICMVGARAGSTENRCPVCLLVCHSRLELIRHLQEHGEKLKDKNKWRCKVCQAVVQDKIAVHVENTHSNESVSCSMCNKQLKNRKSLKQHLFLSHQNGYEIRKNRKVGTVSKEVNR